MSTHSSAHSSDARDLVARSVREDEATAIGLLQEAISIDPLFSEGYAALARNYYKHAWVDAELRLWQQRASIEPSDPHAQERIGWIFSFTGKAEEALTWLERSIALRPSGEWGHFYVGNANLVLGRYDDAERAYRATLEMHPDHSSAHTGLAWTLFADGSDDEALAQCAQMGMTTLDGDRYDVKLADLELFPGNLEVAADRARRAPAENPMSWLGRYWPRGAAATTILAAAMSERDGAVVEDALETSAMVDRTRISNGDECYVPRYDLAAVCALRDERAEACRWLTEAIAAGWWFPDLARRDPLLRSLHRYAPFEGLLKSGPAHGAQ